MIFLQIFKNPSPFPKSKKMKNVGNKLVYVAGSEFALRSLEPYISHNECYQSSNFTSVDCLDDIVRKSEGLIPVVLDYTHSENIQFNNSVPEYIYNRIQGGNLNFRRIIVLPFYEELLPTSENITLDELNKVKKGKIAAFKIANHFSTETPSIKSLDINSSTLIPKLKRVHSANSLKAKPLQYKDEQIVIVQNSPQLNDYIKRVTNIPTVNNAFLKFVKTDSFEKSRKYMRSGNSASTLIMTIGENDELINPRILTNFAQNYPLTKIILLTEREDYSILPSSPNLITGNFGENTIHSNISDSIDFRNKEINKLLNSWGSRYRGIIIAGPRGGGKSTVTKNLLSILPFLYSIPTTVSRDLFEGETDIKDHKDESFFEDYSNSFITTHKTAGKTTGLNDASYSVGYLKDNFDYAYGLKTGVICQVTDPHCLEDLSNAYPDFAVVLVISDGDTIKERVEGRPGNFYQGMESYDAINVFRCSS